MPPNPGRKTTALVLMTMAIAVTLFLTHSAPTRAPTAFDASIAIVTDMPPDISTVVNDNAVVVNQPALDLQAWTANARTTFARDGTYLAEKSGSGEMLGYTGSLAATIPRAFTGTMTANAAFHQDLTSSVTPKLGREDCAISASLATT